MSIRRAVSEEVLRFLRESWHDKTISVKEIAAKVGLRHHDVGRLARSLGLRRQIGRCRKCECGVCKRCRVRASDRARRERKRQGLYVQRRMCECGVCERCRERAYRERKRRGLCSRVKVSLFGETFTIREICKILGLRHHSITRARKRGVWSDAYAVRASKRAAVLRAKAASRVEKLRV
jgi:hypothetical protein